MIFFSGMFEPGTKNEDKSWAEDMTQTVGKCYMGASIAGVGYGAWVSRKIGANVPWRMKINAVLNHCGKHGRSFFLFSFFPFSFPFSFFSYPSFFLYFGFLFLFFPFLFSLLTNNTKTENLVMVWLVFSWLVILSKVSLNT